MLSFFVTAATAANMTVGSLLFASPPHAQPKPCCSARHASSGIASIGNEAPELNSISICMARGWVSGFGCQVSDYLKTKNPKLHLRSLQVAGRQMLFQDGNIRSFFHVPDKPI